MTKLFMFRFRPRWSHAGLLAGLVTGMLLAVPGLGQQRPGTLLPGFWVADAAAQRAAVAAPLAARLTAYRAFTLDLVVLRALLVQAPTEVAGAQGRLALPPLEVALPLPNGTTGRFRVVATQVMEPALAAQYPQIRTYAGVGMDDSTATLHCTVSPLGFQALVLSATGGAFNISPVSISDPQHYLCYARAAVQPDPANQPSCGVRDTSSTTAQSSPPRAGGAPSAGAQARVTAGPASGNLLRTYRLAVAATGEYTQSNGGTVASALASIVSNVNLLNAVFEKEVAARFVLVANTNLVIFTNAATDPYNDTSRTDLMNQNTATLDARIGNSNYDIGHVVSTAGGGLAMHSVCGSVFVGKGTGTTGGGSGPASDPQFFDVFVHEVGHQLGAMHSFNSNNASFCDANRNGGTAWEPGGGTTIMSYSGICASDDIVNISDLQFHAGNLQEITTFLAGTGCAMLVSTGNTPPTVTAPAPKTIPKLTPFQLTASGSDANADPLTYSWEEMDLGPAGPVPINTTPQTPGDTPPLFRSWPPSTSPVRVLPRLNELVNNTTAFGEAAPLVSRQLRFRCTVRDQHTAPGGIVVGGQSSADLTLQVTSAAGPFVVTAPNAATDVWASGGTAPVTWDVANTNQAPVSCATVRILLSTDGGLTYPTTLATNVTNSGSTTVAVPANLDTDQARVMVAAQDNYFFDISNASFRIKAQPTITGFSPTAGAPGTVVTVTGTNFAGLTFVKFGGVVSAAYTIQSPTQLMATVPGGAGTGKISVFNGALTGFSATNFTVGVAPIIGSFSPTSGVPGSSVTISGAALGGATSVQLGGVTCAITANTATSLTVTVPPGPSGPFKVTTAFATTTSVGNFTVLVANAPTISSFSPMNGPVGSPVTITGTNLQYVVAAELNGEPATYTVNSPTSLTLNVPNVTTGLIKLYGPGGAVQSASPFNVTLPSTPGWQWAATASGTSAPTVNDMVRAADGTIYVCGQFGGTTNFGATTLTAIGGVDGFVGALSAAGSWLWAEALAGSQAENVNALALDAQGNLTVAGDFGQTLTLGATTLTSVAYYDSFVARRSAAGQWLWAASAGGSGNDYSTTLAVDASGATYVGGFFGLSAPGLTQITFGTTTLTSHGGTDGYVAKLTATGQWLWAVRAGGNDYDRVTALVVDPATGNVSLTGSFYTTAQFGGLSVTSAGDADFFVAQLTGTGNWQWLVRGGGPNSDLSVAISLDAAGNVLVGGSFRSTIDISNNPGALTALGGSDVFVARLSGTSGQHQWSARGGGSANDDLVAMSTDYLGRIIVAGSYYGPAAFGASPLTTTSANQTDWFVGRLTSTGQWEWGVRAGSNYDDWVRNMVLDPGGNAIVAGTVRVNQSATFPGVAPVTTPNGLIVAQLGNALPPAPALTIITPTSGPVGTTVTLVGTDLGSVTSVTFNGVSVAAADFLNRAATYLTVRVPLGATSGAVLALSPNRSTPAPASFTVSAPSIVGFSPTRGGVGTVVSIIGNGVGGAQTAANLRFNGQAAAALSVVQATYVQATVPAGATTGPISLVSPAGTATSATAFEMVPPPTLTSFTPTNGAVGSSFTLTGADLLDVTTVTLGGLVVPFSISSATSLTVTVAPGAPSGVVRAYSVGGEGVSPSAFTVTTPMPGISALSPTSGGEGTAVTITGSNLSGATSLTFGGTTAPLLSNTATQITTTVPTGLPLGPLTVLVTTAVGSASAAFTVTAQVTPVLTSFSPTSGPVGTLVTLTGTDLGDATSISFNGTPATITSAGPTQLTTLVPTGATTGPLAITTAGGTVTSATPFIVTAPATGWPLRAGTGQDDAALATITDGQGNVYVAGYFTDVAAFGQATLTAVGSSRDAFVARYSSGGVVQWAVRLGGVGTEQIRGLALDTNGDVYVVGDFANTFTFTSAFGTETLTNPNGTINRGFVGKLSSAGVWQFAVGFGSALPASGVDVAVDFSGNVYVGGSFQGTLSFDLTPTVTLTSAGATDGFAARLNVGSGQWDWATRVGGAAFDEVRGLALGGQGSNVVLTGSFSSPTLTFTPAGQQNPLVNAGGNDAFVARLSAFTGAVQWTLGGGGAGDDYGLDVAVSGQGTVSVAASGSAAAALGGNQLTAPATGTWLAVARISSGGAWLSGVASAQSSGAQSALIPKGLVLQSTGAATVVGFYGPAASFGTTTLTSAGGYDGFVARTDVAGTSWAWVQTVGATNGSVAFAEAVALTPNGANAYVAGQFNGSLTQSGTTLISAANSTDLFVGLFGAVSPPPPPPTITSFTPTSGAAGAAVTITGTGFAGATGVQFNGVAAAFTVGSATGITTSVPGGATTGTISVTGPGGTATSAVLFTVIPPAQPPVITALTPASGVIGASVTITGTSFGGATQVAFNGAVAGFTTNLSGTELYTTVPAGATTGPVTVTTAAGTAQSPTFFTVLPAITGFSPAQGVAGTVVTITGTGFGGATEVRFGLDPAVFMLVSSTELTVTVPATNVGGPATLIATTPSGAASSASAFTLLKDLTVSTAQVVVPDYYRNLTVVAGGSATLSGLTRIYGTCVVQAGGSLTDDANLMAGPGAFTVEAGATLRIANPQGITGTGMLSVSGLITLSPAADYEFYGSTSSQQTQGLPAEVRDLVISNTSPGPGGVFLTSPLAVRRVLRLASAASLVTNHRLTLRSDAAGTAMVVNASTGAVLDSATVERYLTPGQAPRLGYRHLASPVTGSSVRDLRCSGFTPRVNAAYNALPTPVLPAAQFPTVFGYDERRGGAAAPDFGTGWYSPTAVTDALLPGRGVSVYMPATSKPDFRGILVNGDVALPGLTRTGANLGNEQKSGWHLLGNPYPAPLSWDLAVPGPGVGQIPAGMSGSISVYKSTGNNNGVYLTRANGMGSLPGGLVPVGQAFFARVTGTGPVNFTFTNALRVTEYANPAHYRSADPRPAVVLALTRDQAPADEVATTTVYFQPGATAEVDEVFDGPQPGHNTGTTPTLLSLTPTGQELAVNALDPAMLAAPVTLALLLDLPEVGRYTLQLDQLANLATSTVALLDHKLGTRTPLAVGASYSFAATQAGADATRFGVELTPAGTVTGTSLLLLPPSAFTIWPNPVAATGELQVSGVAPHMTLQVLDATGRAVRQVAADITGSAHLTVQGLTPGIYTLRAGPATRRLVVE